MKYYLFCGEQYYPWGGVDDLKGVFNTLGEAKSVAVNELFKIDPDGDCGWANIMDNEGNKVWEQH